MHEIKMVPISSFLKERESRIKPNEANNMGLKRLNKIDFSGEIHLTEKPTNTDMILIKKGDLVISGINVEKGAVAVYQGNEDILATIHYSAYIFDKTKIDIEYFKTFLKSKSFKDIINSQIRSGIKTELKAKNFLPLEINLPDLEAQIKIKNKLNLKFNEISELDSINNKNYSYISKLHQQILQEAIQGKLVNQDSKDEPASELLKKIKAEKEKLIKEKKIKKEKPLSSISDDEIPYELPKGWEWVRLTDLISILGDGLHGTPNYSEDGEYFFINGNNLFDGQILIKGNTKRVSLKEYNKYKKDLNERSVLVSINGTLGNVAFYNKEKIILGKSACYFNLFDRINKEYVKSLITTNYFLDYIFKNATHTTINNVSLQSMRLFPVPLPPLSEQKRIVEKVDQLMKLCDDLEKQVKENQKNSGKLMEAVLRESFENDQRPLSS